VTFPPLLQPIKAGTRFSDPGDARLSWLGDIYQGGIPARRRSPIPGSTLSNFVHATNDAKLPTNLKYRLRHGFNEAHSPTAAAHRSISIARPMTRSVMAFISR